jgi:LPXTG-motif cell wall-anchored protein
VASAASNGGASSVADPPIHGTVKGFATGDFTYLDALKLMGTSVAQLSLAQSASGVSNTSLQTVDTLQQELLTTQKPTGHNAYARGAGVSVNLGGGDASIPQIQLTQAESVSPPRTKAKTADVLNLPLSPLASVDVQPDIAAANTTSKDNFCVLGGPLSMGQATIANAEVIQPAANQAIVAADGTVQHTSIEELDPNKSNAFGLNSISYLHTAEIQLFKGIPGAEIDIKVLNPIALEAFAGGDSSSTINYGSGDGATDVLSINGNVLTAQQLFGTNGVTIDVDGLLRVQIGGKPTITSNTNDSVAATADLISIQVISLNNNTQSSVGGPLGPVLNPVLNPVLSALDSATKQIDNALTGLGIQKGADLRVGHFEANSQVPTGGIRCQIPVSKVPSTQNVVAGNSFTVAIRADNPYDCTLTHVKFEDQIKDLVNNPTWNVKSTSPADDTSSTNSDLTWSKMPDIPPGGHDDVTVTIDIPAGSPSGELEDTATVTADCASGNGSALQGIGGSAQNVSLTGAVTLQGPTVQGLAPKRVILPNTGSSPWLPIGGGLLALSGLSLFALRRRAIGSS